MSSLKRTTSLFLLRSLFLSSPKSSFAFSPTKTFITRPSRQITSSTTFLNVMSTDTYKRVKLDDNVSDKVIGTHSGSFQADEAMGVFILRQLPEYRNSRVVRSRDMKVLEPLDIVIDVAGVYDHALQRYDHHQRGYDERFDQGKEGKDGRCTKLSASGLVYRHYGRQVIQEFYPNLSDDHLELAYKKLYNSLLEALDAIDTGVEQVAADVSMVYYDSTGLSSRVGRLNPRWNEVDANGQEPNPDERFELASAACGEDFCAVLTKIVESDIPARDFVEKAVLARLETDPSGEIIKFDSGGLPWKTHLYDLEKEHKIDPLVKFALYTDQGGMWRIQAVTVEGQAFENRLSLPEEWRGVRDEELETVTKIPGSKFCHAAGFIGGATTYEGVLEMARVALTRK